MLSARLRSARRTGRDPYDDVVVHQQSAMPEQLLIPFPDAGEDIDFEPRSALDMTALRAPEGVPHGRGGPRFTAERLRHLQDAFAAAADRVRATMDRYVERDDADAVRPVCQGDQQVHRP
ncbi:hypothetical protein ACFWWC_36685 [Streptomyces sp. NPDC058642]|uniref:hypothetical protein n=1 Tax=Streptomyces sp. NPDC058642 TaxID=3346572 RepID=UPI0036650ECE